MQHKQIQESFLALRLKNNLGFLLKLFSFGVVFFYCLHVSPTLAAKIYKWKDDQGHTHFTDRMENVPTESRDQLNELEYTQRATNEPADRKETERTVEKEDANNNQFFIPFKSTEGMQSRIIIDVKFNNQVTVPMLFDTGSPSVILSESLASRLGLFDSDRSNLMVFISGIGGEQAAFRTIINKVSIGDITEESIPAHIVPNISSAFDGLIGMNMLSGYNITIDSINKRLVVSPNPAAKGLPAGRDKLWWQRTFQEFRYHKDFWETHAELVRRGKGPYSGMTSSHLEMYEEATKYQAEVAGDLYGKLNQFAKWRVVPMTWRK